MMKRLSSSRLMPFIEGLPIADGFQDIKAANFRASVKLQQSIQKMELEYRHIVNNLDREKEKLLAADKKRSSRVHTRAHSLPCIQETDKPSEQLSLSCADEIEEVNASANHRKKQETSELPQINSSASGRFFTDVYQQEKRERRNALEVYKPPQHFPNLASREENYDLGNRPIRKPRSWSWNTERESRHEHIGKDRSGILSKSTESDGARFLARRKLQSEDKECKSSVKDLSPKEGQKEDSHSGTVKTDSGEKPIDGIELQGTNTAKTPSETDSKNETVASKIRAHTSPGDQGGGEKLPENSQRGSQSDRLLPPNTTPNKTVLEDNRTIKPDDRPTSRERAEYIRRIRSSEDFSGIKDERFTAYSSSVERGKKKRARRMSLDENATIRS